MFGRVLPGVSWSYAVLNSKAKEKKRFLTPVAGNAIRTVVEAGYARGVKVLVSEEMQHDEPEMVYYKESFVHDVTPMPIGRRGS